VNPIAPATITLPDTAPAVSTAAIGALLDTIAPMLADKPPMPFSGIVAVLNANGISEGAQGQALRRVLNARLLAGQVQRLPGNLYKFGAAPAQGAPRASLPDATPEPSPLVAEDSFMRPTLDEHFRMAPGLRDYLKGIATAAQGGSIEQVRFVGPAGCGKTEAALQLAALAGFDAFIMDCSVVREPRDWFGSRTVRGGAVVWQDSPFTHAIQRGRCVVILDEANRASLNVGNSLLPLLDRRRASLIAERGSVVRVAPSTVFVATMNEGAQFTGTGPLDAALRDRFPRVVEFTYLPAREEAALLVDRTGIDRDNADRLVELAAKTRATHGSTGLAQFGTALSTRQLIAAAADLKTAGIGSLAYTIANLFPADGGAESERAQVVALLVGKFGAAAGKGASDEV
jgi:nitric oxide reductase NorQ protein